MADRITQDHEHPDEVDEIVMSNVTVHLERMNDGYYWMGITDANGHTTHVDIFKVQRRVAAKVRR